MSLMKTVRFLPALVLLCSAQSATTQELNDAVVVSNALPEKFLKPGADQIAIEEDKRSRMTVPVNIVDSGPYEFIIDTAAQRTILSTEVAGKLDLDLEERVNVIALAGNTTVQTVYVPELTLGRQSYNGLISPTFRSNNLGADGVLGLDSLQGQRILFDFVGRTISVEDTRKKIRRSSAREIVVTAKRRSGQLIFTRATIQGIKVNVIIDTGGELSIGNKALQKRLRLRNSALRQIDLIDVTGRTVAADYGVAKDLQIGRARFGNVPIAFSDIEPFRALKLQKRPSLFLGMNALRSFDRMAIDFANRKIYFKLPQGA